MRIDIKVRHDEVPFPDSKPADTNKGNHPKTVKLPPRRSKARTSTTADGLYIVFELSGHPPKDRSAREEPLRWSHTDSRRGTLSDKPCYDRILMSMHRERLDPSTSQQAREQNHP